MMAGNTFFVLILTTGCICGTAEYCNINDLPRGDWEIQFAHPEGRDDAGQGMKSPGTEAIFTCNVVGYVISGVDTTFCRLGEWSGPAPLCERRRCPKVELPNGRFIYRDISNTEIDEPRHRDYRRAICSSGHSLRGEPWTECWNGEWGAELPTCDEDPCRVFGEDDVPNYLVVTYEAWSGSRIYPDGGLVHSRTLAIFTCKEKGTRIKEGYERVMCKRGTWRGQFPECENATCTVGTIENGYVVRDGSEPFAQEASHGDWRNFTCEMGFTILGQERSQCLAGEWTAYKPSCIEGERCPIGQCVVPYINNGHYSLHQGGPAVTNGTCLRHWDFLYLTCHYGEPPIGRSVYVCNNGELLTGNDDNNFSTCLRGPSNCPMPETNNHVEMFVGDAYIPINRQDSFTEGDFITSRCQNPRIQTFSGSVIRRCEGGQWNGNPAHCESTNISMSVSNTVLQGIAENGTIVVFAVTGHVNIHCQSPGFSSVSMFKDNVTLQSHSKNRQSNHRFVRIHDPSTADSGTYRCDRNEQSHSISVIFKAITCPYPQLPEGGDQWVHHSAPANRDGLLGFVFTETLSLSCTEGYRPNDRTSNPTCTHHGTWSNISQQRCIPI